MRKTLKLAAAATLFATPALAAVPNLENPLYAPTAGEVYGKLGVGVMYKKANDNQAMQDKGLVGETEFPIWRGNANIGVGITDFLSVRGKFAYTHDGDIDRAGMNDGRLGLNFRASEFLPTDGWVWDIYADAHLGGISEMKAQAIPTVYTPAQLVANPKLSPLTFSYDNYSNGRWGAWAGTQVGKTFDKVTVAAFAEVLRTFGNDNNTIEITPAAKARLTSLGQGALVAVMPNSFSVDTASTWEYSAGLNSLYQMDDTWSFGGGFTYKHRAENAIDAVNIVATIPAGQAGVDAFAKAFVGPMKDGIDEYILSVVVANQLTDNVQVALYGEYTFDDAMAKSSNGTDIKAELGARVNVRF